MKIEYEFSEEQEKKYNEWIEGLKYKKSGKLEGLVSFVLTYTGIGIGIKAILKRNNGTEHHLDLTDVETW